jgi:hypothetical protein
MHNQYGSNHYGYGPISMRVFTCEGTRQWKLHADVPDGVSFLGSERALSRGQTSGGLVGLPPVLRSPLGGVSIMGGASQFVVGVGGGFLVERRPARCQKQLLSDRDPEYAWPYLASSLLSPQALSGGSLRSLLPQL